MTTRNTSARMAGLLYLVVVVTGMYSLAYVPSRLNVSGDLHATLHNLVASENLFRTGMAAFAAEQAAFLLLPFALYRLLRPAGESAARLMVALALVSIPISLVALGHRLDALDLLTDAGTRRAFSQEQLEGMAKLALDAYGSDLLLASLFWGLWLWPFGYLVLKSRLVPRVFGVLLLLGGLGYVMDVFGKLLGTSYPDTALAGGMMLVAAAGEIGTCLWLLVVGARGGTAGNPSRPKESA